MAEMGSALLNWLIADFHCFGLAGQNWMPALLGGAIALFVGAALLDRRYKDRAGRL